MFQGKSSNNTSTQPHQQTMFIQPSVKVDKADGTPEKNTATDVEVQTTVSNPINSFVGKGNFFAPVQANTQENQEAEEVSTLEEKTSTNEKSLDADTNKNIEQANDVSSNDKSVKDSNIANNKTAKSDNAGAQKTSGDGGGKSTTWQSESGGKQDEKETEEVVELPTENTKVYTDALASQPPMAFIGGVKRSGEDSLVAQQSEQKALQDSLPEIEQPTGIPVKGKAQQEKVKQKVAQEENKYKGASIKLSDTTPTGKKEGHKIEETNIQPPSTFAGKLKSFFGITKTGTEEDKKNKIKSGIKNLPTSESVDTNPGIAPKVDLTGQANPNKNEKNTQAAEASVTKDQTKNLEESKIYRGENDIYPEMEVEMLSPSIELTEIEVNSALEAEMPPVSAEVSKAFDEGAKGHLDKEVGKEKAKQDEAYAKMEKDQEKERVENEIKIEAETSRVQKEQEAAQLQAKTDVEKQRGDWKKENQAVKDEYATKSTKEKKKVDQDIDTKTKETDQKVNAEYTKAKETGEQKVVEANKDAKAKKEKAKKESENKSWWDRAVDAVSSFFDALKEALNAIFDGLRKLVKGLIEAAKKLANKLIDLARDAIIGMIKAFGEVLKGFVNIALAAFPKLRDKFNAAIDAAVNKATELVNKLAEGLKKVVSALLDALGAVLDAILAAYQALYNLLLDALKFLTIGLIKVLQFLWNLVEGAWNAPGEFFGALAKEAIGGDPSKPLDNFEVPQGQEANWTKAMGLEVGKTALPNEQATKKQVPEKLQTILTKNKLSRKDVTLEPYPAVELSPEIKAQLATMPDGGIMDLGGAGSEAISTKEFQASAADVSGYDLNSIHDTAEEQVGESVENAEQTTEAVADGMGTESSSGPDWKKMSDDQKLDHYLAQMEQPNKEAGAQQPQPSTQKAQPEIDNSPEVLITKTGRLNAGKRLAFMGSQMMTGLKVMWNQYKVWIISALVAALLVAGVIAFFTGGAGLALAVDIIVKAMIVIFGAIAVYKAMGHIWDYVKFAWAGDTKKAGQSLATALAVIVVEFFLDKILLGMAKVFKRIMKAAKAVVKSTKAGRKLFKGASKVSRFAKTSIKKGVSKIKGSKLVVNMKGRVGKGVKTFSELRNKILDKFKFKKAWFEKHGKWIELWGDFNPKVILMRDDGTYEFQELSALPPGQRAKLNKGTQIGTTFKSKKTQKVIVSDAFETKFKNMTPQEQLDSLAELKAKSKATRRAEGMKGSRPEPTIKSKFVPESQQIPEVDAGKVFDPADTQLINNKIGQRPGMVKKDLIKNSEEVGELAVDAHAKANGMVHEFTGANSRNLDKVYSKKVNGKTEYYVYEAKGGNSELGVKKVDEINPATGNNHIAEQGTKQNLEQTIKEMQVSGDPAKKAIADKLDRALKARPPRIKFLYLKQQLNSSGTGIGDLTVRQFDI